MDIHNRIAGWAFDYEQIWKNNVSLGADGSIVNGNHWKLGNDGSGQIANGNISWNYSGAVTFSPSVSLVWKEPIEDITTALGGGSFSKAHPTDGNGYLYRNPDSYPGKRRRYRCPKYPRRNALHRSYRRRKYQCK